MTKPAAFLHFLAHERFKKMVFITFILFLLTLTFFAFHHYGYHAVSQTTSKLGNVYENVDSQYTMQYPADWEYIKPDYATVLFSGKEGSMASYSTINVQSILEKPEGGKFSTMDELISALKQQAAKYFSDLKIDEEGMINFEKIALNNVLQGRYLILSYTLHGEKIKQLQYIFERKDKKAFYGWAYTSTEDVYEKFFPTAQAMFKSWKVY